jgi:carboxyl-terminal processing protease
LFRRHIRATTRVGAPIILALLFGCGLADRFADPARHDAPHDMFVSGFEDVDSFYITQVDFNQFTMAGLDQLKTLDSSVQVVRQGDKVELLVDRHPAGAFPAPKSDDPKGWGNLTADLVEQARKTSPSFAKEPDEDVYEAVFTAGLARLDNFSRYWTPKEATENRASREGFGGIGIRVAVEDKVVRVISVQHYTPAERAGLKAEDLITHINNQPVGGLDQEAVIDMLRGPIGSKVAVTVTRAGKGPLNVALTRAHIVPETVAYQRHGDAAYIQVYGFNVDTADSLRKEMTNARREIGADLKGYILDLRDNPGGLLDQSVAVSDLFMNEGRIVSSHGRHPDSHQYFEATPGDIAKGKPIIVLINGDSASAAEIVAAALQDSGRAVVVGSNSYGKGTVQTVLHLPNDGEMTLTWARFHAPSGYTLNHLGVLPSICTNHGQEKVSDLIDELRQGRIQAIPTAQRNATNPEDTPALDRLRAACPARPGEEEIDEQVAARLLDDPTLYRRAIHLADLPRQPETGAGVISQAQP